MKNNERVFLGVTTIIMITVCCLLGLRYLYHSDTNISGPVIDNPQNQEQIENI